MSDKIDMTPFMNKHKAGDLAKEQAQIKTVFVLYHHGVVKRLFNTKHDVEVFLTCIGAVDIDKHWLCIEADCKRV